MFEQYLNNTTNISTCKTLNQSGQSNQLYFSQSNQQNCTPPVLRKYFLCSFTAQDIPVIRYNIKIFLYFKAVSRFPLLCK